ncbi:hypothetical protein E2C01_038929 [Portunus trituberculatus]|uniref:Uncharacterized protein n=1 Tax=Portunus trituberculatus TaxID=210409 RepID=A0A5B7FIG8_PORTR|nr:hypothetical protein [Portunus trituberculatus]
MEAATKEEEEETTRQEEEEEESGPEDRSLLTHKIGRPHHPPGAWGCPHPGEAPDPCIHR